MRLGFSETLSEALRLAESEARELRQEFVGTEHLLLGILKVQHGDAVRALRAATDLDELRRTLLSALPRGKDPVTVTGRLPTSPKAQRVINSAITEAQASNAPKVSTRNILLALLREEEGAISESLRKSGADLEELLTQLPRATSEIEN